MSPRSRKPLFAVGVPVTLLAGAEVLLRVLVPRDDLVDRWERRDGWVAWEGEGPAPQPNRSDVQFDGVYRWEIRTNEWGLRESHRTPQRKPPNSMRILALGDSWIFGSSVDQGHTISDELEPALSVHFGEPVEVLNGGVVGSSGFDMVRQWARLAAALELDGVMIGRPHNPRRAAAVAERRTGWYAAYSGAPPTDLRLYLVLRHLIRPWRAPRYSVPSHSADDVAIDTADLVNLARDAIASGHFVWFLDFPDDHSDHREDGTRPFTPGMAAALAAEGAQVMGHALGERACWGYEDTGHPSADGDRVIASAVVAALSAPQTHLVAAPRCGRDPL